MDSTSFEPSFRLFRQLRLSVQIQVILSFQPDTHQIPSSITSSTVLALSVHLRHMFAWMADFVESADHQLQTILHNLLAAQHGKGAADFEAGLRSYFLAAVPTLLLFF